MPCWPTARSHTPLQPWMIPRQLNIPTAYAICHLMALSSLHVFRQLQLCLPGVRVFLDVDDLKDISALESSIEQSAVVLIFLSKNYFRSRNWCGSHHGS